jgi:uncharacterized membrane protein
MDIVNIIVRVIHIGSVVALVGGTLFMVFAMKPSLKLVDDQLQDALLKLARKRFMRITHTAITLLILSGAWSWYQNFEVYRNASKAVHGILGMKVLIAVAIFVIIFGTAMGVIKGCPVKWAWVNLVLALIVIILAAIVRAMHMAAL